MQMMFNEDLQLTWIGIMFIERLLHAIKSAHTNID